MGCVVFQSSEFVNILRFDNNQDVVRRSVPLKPVVCIVWSVRIFPNDLSIEPDSYFSSSVDFDDQQ